MTEKRGKNVFAALRTVFSLSFAFLIIMPSFLSAAITYKAKANTSLNTNQNTLKFTTSTGVNRILVAGVLIRDERATYAISNITYAGQSFTKVTRTAAGSGSTGTALELWVLLNPPSGSGTVTLVRTTGVRAILGVAEYNGVSSTGNFALWSGVSNAYSVNLNTTGSNSYIAGLAGQRHNVFFESITLTKGTGITDRWNQSYSSWSSYSRAIGHDRAAGAAGSYTMSYTSNRNDIGGIIAVELRPAAPTITLVSPSVGYIGGGQTVNITGTNFEPGCTVTFDGISASVTYNSRTSLTVTTPAHASPGLINVVVTNPDSQTATGSYTYSATAPPQVISCSPASGLTLGTQTTTISGLNFVNGCSVIIGGIAATNVVFNNSSSLTVLPPAHAAGLVSVTVINPDTQTYTLNNAYTYVIPAPQVLYCDPATGRTTGGQTITVKGKYFVSGCTVTIGGTAATGVTFISSDTITLVTPAHSQGAVDVVVRNPDAQTGTLTDGFTYFSLPAPAIVSCSPASGSTAGGQAITVNGSGFVSGCTVNVDGLNASVSLISSTELHITTPAHAAGSVDVTVINPDTQSATLAFGFTYIVPPTVTSIVKNTGTSDGGQVITVNGTDFRTGCTVEIDGIACAVNRINSAQLLVTTPAHSAGSVSLGVYNADNTSVLIPSAFAYDGSAPVITLGATIPLAVGGTYTENATALDDTDGDITSSIVRVIKDHLNTVQASVSSAAPETYTITYDVTDEAGNAAIQQTRTVNVTDQTPPVIDLRGGGSYIALTAGDTYEEMAVATDNVDGDLTSSLNIEIRDGLNNVVPSVDASVPGDFTITYNVSDAAGNAAVQQTRQVHVVADTLLGLSIITLPDKTVYKVGEDFNSEGLEVTGNYGLAGYLPMFINELQISGFSSLTAADDLVITVSKGIISDTFTVDIIDVAAIAITRNADKLTYDIGEPLDITGLEVTGEYTNYTNEILPVTLSDITGFNSSAADADQTITVTIGTKTATFDVHIVPTLASIAVTNPPSKLVYDIGESLDISGLIVTGTYTDSSTALLTVTGANIIGFNSTAANSDETLTVTYGGKTAFFNVSIVPTLVSIAITHPADKIQYNTGDSLDISGLQITGTYTDGNQRIETITAGNISGFNSSLPQTGQVLTVTVGGKTTTYTIDIAQPLLTGIAITTPATKLIYNIGELFDMAGLIVTGYYDDLSSAILPITDDDISGFDSSAVASGQVITVTYQGYTATYTVDIITDPPTVDTCTPDNGPNTGGTAVTLYGSNFQPGCTVYFGTALATNVSFVDETELTLDTPANPAGMSDVTVINPDTGVGTGYGIYTYTGPTATETNTASPTITASRTITATATKTITHTRTVTPVVSATPTFTVTNTLTQTRTATVTKTITETATQTATRTITATITITSTKTSTPTITMTSTITPTPSVTPTITPIPELAKAESGKSNVYPQPAKDKVTIVYGLNEPALTTIYIYTVSGKPAADITVSAIASQENKITVNLTKFAPGVYFYIIKAKTQKGNEIAFKPGKFLVAK